MTRYPLLAELRARRQRLEAEIAAPHAANAVRAWEEAARERREREALERIMGNKLLPHILEHIGHKLSERLYREIMQAVAKSETATGVTTLELPTEMLISADRKSIVSRVVDWWKMDCAPKVSFRARESVKSRSTVLDIRLPAMGYREAIEDLPSNFDN